MAGARGTMGDNASTENNQLAESEYLEYHAYLEKLVGRRTRELERAKEKLETEVALHRATVLALRQSEASFRAVADTAPDIIARFDRDLRHLYVNPAVERVTGLKREDFMGKTNRELGMPEDLCERWEGWTREVFRTGEVKSAYFDFESPEGTKVFHMRLAPEVSQSGEVASVVTASRDVTDAKLAEAALRRSEASFRTLAENAPCVIVRLDPDLTIRYANPASRNVTGRDLSEIKGMKLGDIGLPARPINLLKMAFRKVFRTGKSQKFKARIEAGREPRRFEVLIVPEGSSTGGMDTCLAIVHDITDSEKAMDLLQRDKAATARLVEERTAELLDKELELERARRLSDIGTLAATVAHELRNPLAVIQTAVYNIKKKRETRRVDRHLASIEKKIAESNRIISNLLSYARLKKPELEEADLSNLIEEHLAAAGNRFPKHDVRVVKRIGAIKHGIFRVDAGQIGEVFANIIGNAYQAMEEGRGKLSVVAGIDDGGKNLLISFSDDGAGMNEAEMARALDPFFTTKSKGTGLGLTISCDIVKLHGGSLAMESREGKGTKVTITLPVR